MLFLDLHLLLLLLLRDLIFPLDVLVPSQDVVERSWDRSEEHEFDCCLE